MKYKIAILLFIFSGSLFGQDLTYPIFDFKGDSIGCMENGRSPIQLGENQIDIGRFYEVQVNLEANRIYVMELRAPGSCTVRCQKYLKIFDLTGNLIYSDPYQKPITCSYDKLFSIAKNGDLAFCSFKTEQDNKSVYEIIRLDKDGNEIFRKPISVKTKSLFTGSYFDMNSKGEFIVSFFTLNRDSSLKQKFILKRFNRKGRRIWKKTLNFRLLDVSINENGQAAILTKPADGVEYSQVILVSSKGKKTFNIVLEDHFGIIEFKNDSILNLRQQFHYQSHKRKSIEIEKLKAKQF